MVNNQKQSHISSPQWAREQLLRHGRELPMSERITHAPLATALVAIALSILLPLAVAGLYARLTGLQAPPACATGEIEALTTDCEVRP